MERSDFRQAQLVVRRMYDIFRNYTDVLGICLYYNNYYYFYSLENCDKGGGVAKFSCYGLALETYTYREQTYQEMITLKFERILNEPNI